MRKKKKKKIGTNSEIHRKFRVLFKDKNLECLLNIELEMSDGALG